ncbi:MAG: DUF2752 domain-containing protein [Deltaproteobacteria bacterium]|nr:DUF2752 domain-containing protein [Deltaproteobacteria bacterium]
MDGAVFSWNRPPSYWDVVGVHFPLALASGIALAVSMWVPFRLLSLVPCTFLQFTGYPCPFCGFSRSFWAMSGGDWAFAFRNCPLACLMYMGTAIVFAWNMAALLLGLRIARGRFLKLGRGLVPWFIGASSALLVLNWAYRLGLGLR